MEELDLHGVRHQDAGRVVENFLVVNEMPVQIITGNSTRMQKIVRDVCERHGYNADYPHHYNLGALVITDGH